MGNYNVISGLIVNILRVLLIRKLMERFLPAEDADGRKVQAGFFLYYLLTTVLFVLFQVSATYEIGNCLGILGLTLLYPQSASGSFQSVSENFHPISKSPLHKVFLRGAWKKKLWVSLVICSIDMACSLAVYFALGQRDMYMYQQAIQTLLFLICVTLIDHMAYPADSREIAFDKRQTSILIIIPAVSVFLLCVLLYGRAAGMTAFLICVSMLTINLSVFWLYHIMAENYKTVREHEIYRQQTYAYQNQLEVITESRSRIRALRHDMKNHMLAMQALIGKKDWEGAERYLSSMQDFMANPAEHIATGNDAVDSLLNYKLERAKELLDRVEARVNIPETLTLHSFDLNVILGNLLDNAIEAAGQTEEKELKLAMKLEKGILSVHVRNSCQGIADGKVRRLETTKENAPDHGIGLGNVRRIVEKYHGDMELSCENGKLEADVILYVRDM